MALNKIITIEGMKYRRSYFDGNAARIEAISHKSHINILKEIFEMTITEPTANFTYSPDAVDPLKIEFTNTSTNAVSYSWDFGDNSPADLTANPIHTYAAAGSYTVVLTVQDIAGVSDTETKIITVSPTPVTYTVTLPTGEGYTADFVAGSSSPAVRHSEVNFTVVPTEGYEITSVTDGTHTLTGVNDVYTINAIAADTVITVVVTLIGG